MQVSSPHKPTPTNRTRPQSRAAAAWRFAASVLTIAAVVACGGGAQDQPAASARTQAGITLQTRDAATQVARQPLPASSRTARLQSGVSALSGDGANLISDSGFEAGPPRELFPTDSPWSGEESKAVMIMQGDAAFGGQFLRMQVSDGQSPHCPGCNQAFLFSRFTAKPNTDYVFSFWSRGTPGVDFTASVRARFLGDCHQIPVGCPDEDGDEDLDLGPEPPNYQKLTISSGGAPQTVAATSGWQQTVIPFNSGKYTALAVVFYQVFGGGDHMDLDEVTVTEVASCDPVAGCQPPPSSCSCYGTDSDNNPVESHVCNSTVCGTDFFVWACTTSGYAQTPQTCRPFESPADTTPPSLRLDSPADGMTVRARRGVTISADAADNVGVARVEFSVDGSLLCSVEAPPYQCTWQVPRGVGRNYQVEAVAFDAAGNSQRAAVRVTSVR